MHLFGLNFLIKHDRFEISNIILSEFTFLAFWKAFLTFFFKNLLCSFPNLRWRLQLWVSFCRKRECQHYLEPFKSSALKTQVNSTISTGTRRSLNSFRSNSWEFHGQDFFPHTLADLLEHKVHLLMKTEQLNLQRIFFSSKRTNYSFHLQTEKIHRQFLKF